MKNFLKKINKREITLIVVSMMVIILFCSGYSIGKGISNTNIEATAEIAEPILIVDNNPEISITTTNNYGSYDFKVKNYDENQKITQTNLKYTIEIISEYNDNIKLKLYKDDEEIELENNKSQEFYFYKNIQEEHNYKLQIMYEKGTNTSMADIIQTIQIKVHSEQMKT